MPNSYKAQLKTMRRVLARMRHSETWSEPDCLQMEAAIQTVERALSIAEMDEEMKAQERAPLKSINQSTNP